MTVVLEELDRTVERNPERKKRKEICNLCIVRNVAVWLELWLRFWLRGGPDLPVQQAAQAGSLPPLPARPLLLPPVVLEQVLLLEEVQQHRGHLPPPAALLFSLPDPPPSLLLLHVSIECLPVGGGHALPVPAGLGLGQAAGAEGGPGGRVQPVVATAGRHRHHCRHILAPSQWQRKPKGRRQKATFIFIKRLFTCRAAQLPARARPDRARPAPCPARPAANTTTSETETHNDDHYSSVITVLAHVPLLSTN